MVRDASSRFDGKGHGLMSTVLWAFADRRLTIAGLWTLGLVGVGLSLVLPNQVGRLTQLFTGDQSVTWPPVLRAIVYLVGAQLALSAITYVRTRSEASLRESAIRRLTMRLYARILRFGADFFRSQEVERINARAMEDSNTVGMFWASALVAVPLVVASIVVVGAVMLFDNWLLGLCVVVLSVLSGYFALFDRRVQAINFEVRETWERIRASASETVAGVSEIRNHGAFDHALQGLGKSFRGYQGTMVRFGRLIALFSAMDPLIATVQKGALFAVGAALCVAGSRLAGLSGPMTWAQVIRFMLLAQLFQDSVSQLASQLLQWRLTRESGRRIEEYLRRPCAFEATASGEPLPAEPFPVTYDGVSVTAESGRSILRDVNLGVKAGSHVALCGTSGCGKSTLLQALVRGVEPTAGSCLLSGLPLARFDQLALARGIGLVPQAPVLYNTTIRQNLLLSLRRPGDGCLEDGQGPIDVQRLDHVRDDDDLDRELIEVVRLVGLEADLMSKCLDGPLPAAPPAQAIRERLAPLRQRIVEAVEARRPGSVVRFDRRACFPGTIQENLLGPGVEPGAELAAAVCRMLGDGPVMRDLLLVGYRRLVTEETLAARVGPDTPGLMEWMAPRGARPAPGDGLPAAGHELADLPASDKHALVDIAMASDVEFGRQLADTEDFDARLLSGRETILSRDAEARRRWDAVEGPSFVDALTLRENLLRGRPDPSVHQAQERVDELLSQALREEGLSDATILLGLEFVVGEGGKFLSGGQRQKVAIARVVLKNPSLLLLDEATASLDESSQARIIEMIRTRFAGRTVVSVTHRLNTVREYDRAVVVDRGRLIQEGSYDELAREDGVFRRLVRREDGEAAPEAAPAEAGGPEGPRSELEHKVAMSGVFGRLKSDQLTFVTQAMKISRCPKDGVLFRRGDEGHELFVILDGKIEFFVERGQGDQEASEVVNSLGPGGVFGELAVFAQGRRTVGARAATDATLGTLGREDLMTLIQADPGIAVGLLSTVSNYLARTADAAYDAA